jgi:RNA polymerase sigma-70 factor (ECF subfamily)
MGCASAIGRGRWDWRTLANVALQEANRVLGSVHDAEDAAQEAMIRAYRAQARCETPEAPQAWVRTIARHEAYRLHRRTAPIPTDVRTDVEAAAGDASDRVVARVVAVGVLSRLPTSERSLLVRRYLLDQTSTEIAQELALPAATVRVRLHRAAKRLREETANEGGLGPQARPD